MNYILFMYIIMDLVSVFHDTYQRTLNKSIKVCKIKQECIINDRN